jgi:hypothetical protein
LLQFFWKPEAKAQKPIAEIDDQTLILADQAGKALAQVEQEVSGLLADKFPAGSVSEGSSLCRPF